MMSIAKLIYGNAEWAIVDKDHVSEEYSRWERGASDAVPGSLVAGTRSPAHLLETEKIFRYAEKVSEF